MFWFKDKKVLHEIDMDSPDNRNETIRKRKFLQEPYVA